MNFLYRNITRQYEYELRLPGTYPRRTRAQSKTICDQFESKSNDGDRAGSGGQLIWLLIHSCNRRCLSQNSEVLRKNPTFTFYKRT